MAWYIARTGRSTARPRWPQSSTSRCDAEGAPGAHGVGPTRLVSTRGQERRILLVQVGGHARGQGLGQPVMPNEPTSLSVRRTEDSLAYTHPARPGRRPCARPRTWTTGDAERPDEPVRPSHRGSLVYTAFARLRKDPAPSLSTGLADPAMHRTAQYARAPSVQAFAKSRSAGAEFRSPAYGAVASRRGLAPGPGAVATSATPGEHLWL
jgi:hypothetical protein